MAHGDADAVEAQGLEIQELGLGPAIAAAHKSGALRAPDAFQYHHDHAASLPVMAMMPAVVMTPVVMPAVPMAEVADAARPVIGQDDVAAPIGIIVGRSVISGSKKAPVVEVPMPEGESAMAKTATMKHGTTAEAAAVKHMAATAAEMHAVATAPPAMTAAAMTAAAVTASAAMASAHFGDQSLGDGLRGRRRAWADRRQRVRALGRDGRQHEYRRRDEAQVTDKSAPGIWNLGHS